MTVHEELLAPCGLYRGVCGVYIADHDGNDKFKERLTTVSNCSVEGIKSKGCPSDEPFLWPVMFHKNIQ